MVSLFALLLLAQTPASDAHPEGHAPVATAEKSDKKICKVDPNYTGSRMRKKLCLTQSEWTLRAQGKNAGDLKTMGAR
jgi:hypothetical protein